LDGEEEKTKLESTKERRF